MLDIVLIGDIVQVNEKLDQDPSLLSRRSSFGHQASLWHYLGSNGVELHRQIVPLNLPEIISSFMNRGIDRGMRMHVYGGEHTMKEMLVTSAHPREAGVLDSCLKVLDKKG